jgi:transposase-like protein
MTESTLLVGYEINAQLAKEKIQKSKGLMSRLKKTDAKEVVSLVTKAWNELESILESDSHQCESKVLYTAELNAFSEVKSNATTIVNNSFLLSIITADVDTKFEAVKNERYVAYSKASEFEQNQFSIYLSEIEANFENQEIGIFSWFSAPTDDLARIQKRVAGSFPASIGGELHFFEFHNDGSIFPNFADVETQRFEGKLAGNYSLKFDAAGCTVGIKSLNDITTRLFNSEMISDGATNQSTNKKKVKNESQSSSNKAKLKKTYPESFKREVANAALKEGNTLQSVADEYGISPTLVRNWKVKFSEENKTDKKSGDKDDLPAEHSEKKATAKKLDNDQLTELFGDIEDKINEQGYYAEFVEKAGSHLEYVQLDMDWADDGIWRFVMRLVVEEAVEIDAGDLKIIEDDLELYADRLYQKFKDFGLSHDDRDFNKVEIVAENQSEDDSNKEGGVKKLSDEVLQELFEEKEESLDDKATFATVVSEAGGNLYNVQLDVEFNEDGTWDFVARLICEEIVSLPDSARQFVEDKLEEIGDELHSDFEKFGLDPQMMGDYKVEVTDE